jgi:hypothetical protein
MNERLNYSVLFHFLPHMHEPYDLPVAVYPCLTSLLCTLLSLLVVYISFFSPSRNIPLLVFFLIVFGQ